MAADVAAEEQFGPYLVYERLGVGGMATVHRALERGIEGFERMVALKRLLPHLAEDASFIKSFVREAKLASLLNHVNIVQIFELGRVGTEYFISMEYIDGKDIRRILRHARKVTGPPPLHVTIGILLQLCEALEYAHTKADEAGHPLGLVHRDVSPSNLLLTTAGHLKVIDFGIAKAQSSTLRTQTGRVKGKLAYMAPEAISGKDLDARSDVFAAGVIAHELLTARPLFASKNEYQTLLKVQRGDILPPSTYNPSCTPDLDAIVLRALERDPDERYASASAMRDDLVELRRRMGIQTGYREITSWVDWAFSIDDRGTPVGSAAEGRRGAIDAPSGAFSINTLDQTGGTFRASQRTPTPTPRARREDDDAVEIAWGGGEGDSAGPVVLDDVPDVSEKHLAPAPVIDTSIESSGLDDIPTPLPSHGTRMSTRSEAVVDDGEVRSGQFERKPPSVPPGTVLSEQIVHLTERKRAMTIPPIPPIPSPLERKASPSVPPPAGVVDRKTLPPPGVVDRKTLPPPGVVDRKTPPSLPPPIPTDRKTPTSLPPPMPERRTTAQGAAVAPPDAEVADPTSRTMAVPEGVPEDTTDDDASAEGAVDGAVDVDLDTGPNRERYEAADTMPSLPQVPRPTPALRPSAPGLDAGLGRVPRTKPGMQPARVRTSHAQTTAPVDVDDAADLADTGTSPRRRPDNRVTIGSAIVERELRPRNGWFVLFGIVLAGLAATGVTLYATRGQDTIATVAELPHSSTGKAGTLKFVAEPSDVEIRIEGQDAHVGSPWATPLDPGIHQIEIHRTGYKAWLTSIEVSANETQILRVVLEPLGSSVTAEATLILAPTPSGLDVVLDGQPLAVKTPIRMPIKVGPHTILLRRNGVDVWQQNVAAAPSVDYAFSPVIDKPREPIEPRIEPRREPATEPEAAKEKDKDKGKERPADPEPSPEPPVVVPPPVQPPVASVPLDARGTAAGSAAEGRRGSNDVAEKAVVVPPPVVPEVHTGPVTVAPTAVTKLSGETPSLGIAKNSDVPPLVAAKVCIDPAGQVSSVNVLTKLDHHAMSDLADAMRGWRYAPYKQHGSALAACFVVSFRVK
jgi:serine/threonine protein kinase